MRGEMLLALASLLFGLFLANEPARAENSEMCIPQFADGFDGQSIWQTQLFVDGRALDADQTVINAFSPNGQLLHRVAPGGFFFRGGFFERSQSPFFARIPVFGSSSLSDLFFQPLRTGFLIVESPGFLNFTALIRQFNLRGELVSQLVISPFDPFRRATLLVQEIQAREMAFALANTDTLKRALGRFDFFPLGSQVPLFSFPFDIGPRSQFSSFLFNIFPQLTSTSLRGFIRISSDNPISLMAITLDGNAMQQVTVMIEE